MSLFISEDMAKTHLKNVFAKPAFDDYTGSVLATLRHGIVYLEFPETDCREPG